MARGPLFVLLAAFTLFGCRSAEVGDGRFPDAEVKDAEFFFERDGSRIGFADADSGAHPDARPVDAGFEDAFVPDHGFVDAEPLDFGLLDATAPPDFGPPDTGAPDVGPPDSGCLAAGPAAAFSVNVPTIEVSGLITVNGVRATASGGRVVLVSRTAGDALLGDPADLQYAAPVVPGAYDAVYSFAGGTTIAGAVRNQRFVLQERLLLDRDTRYDVNLNAYEIEGSLLVDGRQNSVNGGAIVLKNVLTGDEAIVGGFDSTGLYSALVLAGTYDVLYRAGTSASRPGPLGNTEVVVDRNLMVFGPTHYDVDIASATLTGAITVAGQLNAASGGAVQLRDRTTGGTARLGPAGNGRPYVARVAQGQYDLEYINTQSDPTGPAVRNRRARIGGPITIAGDATVDVDVPVVNVSGSFTVDGQLAPTGSRVYARSADGDLAYLGTPATPNYTAAIVPGRYDLVTVVLGDGFVSTVRNRMGVIDRGVVLTSTGAATVDRDIATTTLTGRLTVNGARATIGGTAVYLRSGDGDAALLGFPQDLAAYSVKVLPGTYDVVFANELVEPESAAVRNSAFVVTASVTVTPGAMTLDVDMPATAVTGQLLVNGRVAADPHGRVFLNGLDGVDRAYLGSPSRTTLYQANVAPGLYEFVHENSQPGRLDVAVRNTQAVLGCVVVAP